MNTENREPKSNVRPLHTAKWLSVFGLVFLLDSSSILHSQPAPPPNRVLDLDGQGDYVRLPAAGFTNLAQATVEAWSRWRTFAAAARVFDFGERQREMYVAGPSANTAVAGSGGSLKFLIVDAAGNRRRVEVFGGIRYNEWVHIAAVTGPGGVRLYLNGMLVATNAYTGSLSSIGGQNYFLGRDNYADNRPAMLNGQLDEVRVWSVRRTESEIRETMSRKLTGREPGLV